MNPEPPPIADATATPTTRAADALPPLSQSIGAALLLLGATWVLGGMAGESFHSSLGVDPASRLYLQVGTSALALICGVGALYVGSLAGRRLWLRWQGDEPPDPRSDAIRARHRTMWIARLPFLLTQVGMLICSFWVAPISGNTRLLLSALGLIWWCAYELIYVGMIRRPKQMP